MTVGELIALLERYDKDSQVFHKVFLDSDVFDQRVLYEITDFIDSKTVFLTYR